MTTPLVPNKWHLRRVAESASKACLICYKQTTAVLITPDNKDFFYVCMGHLSDRGFCTPDADEVKLRKQASEKEELEREKEQVIAAYKAKRDKKKAAAKDKDKDKDKETDAKKEDEKKEKKVAKTKEDEEEESNDKEEKKELEAIDKKIAGQKEDDGVRVYVLSRTFYQQRVDRIRNAQQAKRDRDRLRNPGTFPSVPSALPGVPGDAPP